MKHASSREAARLGLTLRGCREESRYPTPRAFYKAWGKHLLLCDLKTYRRIEAGESIPSPRLFGRLLEALTLTCNAKTLAALSRAYALVLFGEAAPWATEVLAQGSVREPTSAEVAPLTRFQWRLLLTDDACLACYCALISGPGPTEELCLSPDFAPPLIRRALKRLTKAGLISGGDPGPWKAAAPGRLDATSGDGSVGAPAELARACAALRRNGERLLELFKVFHSSTAQAQENFRMLSQEISRALETPAPRAGRLRPTVFLELSLRTLMPDPRIPS